MGRTCWEHKERTDVQDIGEIFHWCELSIKTEESVVEDADDIGKVNCELVQHEDTTGTHKISNTVNLEILAAKVSRIIDTLVNINL